MEIEITEAFKKNGVKYSQGDLIEIESEEHLTKSDGFDILEQGYGKKVEKIGEVQDVESDDMTDALALSNCEIYNEIEERVKANHDFENEENLVKVCVSILEETGRDRRTEQMNKNRSGNYNNSGSDNQGSSNSSDGEPATDGQISYLENLEENKHTDISVPENPTKKQASDLIDKANNQIPATPKQKKQLKKVNRWEKGMSKKEASEVLDEVFGDDE